MQTSAETRPARLPDGMTPGPETLRAFRWVLVNTALANITSSFLWFALTFWAYLETRSVLATSIIGGAFMLLVAVFGTVFGSIVDRHRKKQVMIASSLVTLVTYAVAGVLYRVFPEQRLVDWGGPVFWVFVLVILSGSVVESMRNIALGTTVTLLVPDGERDRANGAVGAVAGIAFMVTSVFSGLAIGQLGLGWTIAISVVLTAVALGHLMVVPLPEQAPERGDHNRVGFHIGTALETIRSVPGLLALLFFATFNNLVGGVFMALMDPYGLTLFSVEAWGLWLGVTSVGFIVGGSIAAKKGLGGRPLRTMLLANAAIAGLGLTFTLREWGWLYVVGIFLFMCVMPIAEAAEATILQRVVPFEKQGRVFGFGQSLEAAASPVSAFLIGPIAQFWLIPYMASDAGRATWGGLLGEGEARGIALVFVIASLLMGAAVIVAFLAPPYRRLTQAYEAAAPARIEA